MATITTDAPTTTNITKPTEEEIYDVIIAMDVLYSCRVMNFNNYDTGKLEFMYWDFENGHITECEKIVCRFMKNYPKFKFSLYLLCLRDLKSITYE